MSNQNQKEISTLNHQFFIDIPNKLISSDIASFLGIHPKNIHNYIKSKLVTQLLDVKPYMPSQRDFLTLSQVEDLFRIAPNQKYVDHLFRLIEDKVIPLFNQHDESKKEKTIMTTQNQLINIKPHNFGTEQVNAVSARELHEFLQVSKKYIDWFKYQIESLQLIENNDYISLSQKREGNNATVITHYVTIEVAKHISMASRCSRGREVRDYFIECEKKAITPALPNNYQNALTLLGVPEQIAPVIAKVYEERDTAVKTKCQISDKKTATAMATASILTQKVKKLEAQLNQSHEYATVRTVERFISNIKFNWRWLKKYSNDNKLEILDVVDPLYGQVKSYHAKAWEHVYGVQLNNIMKGI